MRRSARLVSLSCASLLSACLGAPPEATDATSQALTSASTDVEYPVVVHFFWDRRDRDGEPAIYFREDYQPTAIIYDSTIAARGGTNHSFRRVSVRHVYDDGSLPCWQLLANTVPMPIESRSVQLVVTKRCEASVPVGGYVVTPSSPVAAWDAIARGAIPRIRTSATDSLAGTGLPIAQHPNSTVEFSINVPSSGGRIHGLSLELTGTSSTRGEFDPNPTTRITLITPWGASVPVPHDAAHQTPYLPDQPPDEYNPNGLLGRLPMTFFDEVYADTAFAAPLRGFRPGGVWRVRITDPDHYAVLAWATLRFDLGPSTYATDRDGDDGADLMAYRANAGIVTARNLRPAQSDFAPETVTPTTAANFASVRAADLDGDGTADLVYVGKDQRLRASFGRDNHQVLRTVRLAGNELNDLDDRVVLAGDLDGDGLGDLLVSNTTPASLPGAWRAHYGYGNGDFSSAITVTLGGPTTPYATGGTFLLADLNRDGRADLFVRDPSTGRSYFAWNSQASSRYTVTFASPSSVFIAGSLTSAFNTHDLGLLDVDRDGREDLVVRERGTWRMRYHRQLSSTGYGASQPLLIDGRDTFEGAFVF